MAIVIVHSRTKKQSSGVAPTHQCRIDWPVLGTKSLNCYRCICGLLLPFLCVERMFYGEMPVILHPAQPPSPPFGSLCSSLGPLRCPPHTVSTPLSPGFYACCDPFLGGVHPESHLDCPSVTLSGWNSGSSPGLLLPTGQWPQHLLSSDGTQNDLVYCPSSPTRRQAVRTGTLFCTGLGPQSLDDAQPAFLSEQNQVLDIKAPASVSRLDRLINEHSPRCGEGPAHARPHSRASGARAQSQLAAHSRDTRRPPQSLLARYRQPE